MAHLLRRGESKKISEIKLRERRQSAEETQRWRIGLCVNLMSEAALRQGGHHRLSPAFVDLMKKSMS